MIWTLLHKKAWTSIYHFVRLISHPTGSITMHCRHLVFVGKAFRVICSSNRALHNRFVILPLVAETEKNICEKHLILDIFPCLCINVNQYKQYTEYIHTTGYLHHTRISNCYHLKSAWYFLAGKLSVQWFIFKSDFALGGNIKTMYES